MSLIHKTTNPVTVINLLEKTEAAIMALENCLRVTTVGTARPQCVSPFSSTSREKIVFPTYKGFKKTMLRNSTLSCPSLYSTSASYKKSSFICNAREAVGVQAVTESTWDELVIASETPVLVDFWAPWCGPCRMIEPIVGELAKEYAGKIACYKLNTDDNPSIATKYGIRSIPTVLFFKNGEKKESIIGAVPKSTLSATVDKYLDI
ncbi:PREDICTED: thioredoxin M-type, chloroplastic-like [Lupinus angustifolius]|uniref:thioredoxin M-type, chloroplastic-like n=1 Tax=Lupinus angustifolius TaxID=3871 RepID=UPI00092E94EF|nr:PREDICTED: thioredoxin M-type, chloroplastic-like [Lupinus angustifolius]